MNRARLNLLLGAIVATLAVLAFLETRQDAASVPTLPGPAPEAVQSIRIEHAGETLRLERVDGRWRLAGEPSLPALQGRVDRLLALARARIERAYPADRAKASQLGLDPPKARVQWDPDGFRLDIGGTDPVEGLRYVRYGDRIALISAWEAEAALGDRTEFLSRRLLPEGAEPVEIEIPGLHVRRDAEGHWQVEGRPEVSVDRIHAYLDAWRHARALSVAPMKGKIPAGLPQWRVRFADGRERRFLFQQGKGQPTRLLLPDLHLVYELTASLRKELAELPPDKAPPSAAEESPAAPETAVEAR